MQYRRMRQPGGTYFFTVVTFGHRPLFADAGAVDLLRAAVRAERARRPFTIDAMVVQPDHWHALWTLPEGDADFPQRIAEVKRAVSRALPDADPPTERQKRRRRRRVWQPRYWEHLIRDDDAMPSMSTTSTSIH